MGRLLILIASLTCRSLASLSSCQQVREHYEINECCDDSQNDKLTQMCMPWEAQASAKSYTLTVTRFRTNTTTGVDVLERQQTCSELFSPSDASMRLYASLNASQLCEMCILTEIRVTRGFTAAVRDLYDGLSDDSADAMAAEHLRLSNVPIDISYIVDSVEDVDGLSQSISSQTERLREAYAGVGVDTPPAMRVLSGLADFPMPRGQPCSTVSTCKEVRHEYQYQECCEGLVGETASTRLCAANVVPQNQVTGLVYYGDSDGDFRPDLALQDPLLPFLGLLSDQVRPNVFGYNPELKAGVQLRTAAVGAYMIRILALNQLDEQSLEQLVYEYVTQGVTPTWYTFICDTEDAYLLLMPLINVFGPKLRRAFRAVNATTVPMLHTLQSVSDLRMYERECRDPDNVPIFGGDSDIYDGSENPPFLGGDSDIYGEGPPTSSPSMAPVDGSDISQTPTSSPSMAPVDGSDISQTPTFSPTVAPSYAAYT